MKKVVGLCLEVTKFLISTICTGLTLKEPTSSTNVRLLLEYLHGLRDRGDETGAALRGGDFDDMVGQMLSEGRAMRERAASGEALRLEPTFLTAAARPLFAEISPSSNYNSRRIKIVI